MTAAHPSQWPRVLPGFEHINRIWDPAETQLNAKILPGEYYVTRTDEVISTVLGSCVSACIRDRLTGIGGMNHFMLPGGAGASSKLFSTAANTSEHRYGRSAMDSLIDDIVRHGGQRDQLEVKLFGGGRVLDFDVHKVGEKNVSFARAYLEEHGLTSLAEDLGQDYPRKVVFSPRTGKVRMRRLRRMHKSTVADMESSYCSKGART